MIKFTRNRIIENKEAVKSSYFFTQKELLR